MLPIINDISAKTLEFNYDDDPSFLYVGGFTWLGHYKWIKVQEHDNKSRTSPISPVRSPTMAGGLYAIDRKYFWKIGSYDDKMDGWGGENLEMSFRVSQISSSRHASIDMWNYIVMYMCNYKHVSQIFTSPVALR